MTTPPCMSFSLITVMKCLKKYLKEGTTLSCSLFQWITRIMNELKEEEKKRKYVLTKYKTFYCANNFILNDK